MSTEQPNYPLHSITLEMILTRLLDHYGWQRLDRKFTINCFNKDPSIKSSLKFQRRTPWAGKKVETLVETLYLRTKFPERKKVRKEKG